MAWLRCGDCGHDKLVANSRKRRGFCPSCGARRLAWAAAHLLDHNGVHPRRCSEETTAISYLAERTLARHLGMGAGTIQYVC